MTSCLQDLIPYNNKRTKATKSVRVIGNPPKEMKWVVRSINKIEQKQNVVMGKRDA